jgi:hypothetical protein
LVFVHRNKKDLMKARVFSREFLPVKPVFHFARIVPKRAGEHAQIEVILLYLLIIKFKYFENCADVMRSVICINYATRSVICINDAAKTAPTYA